MVHRFQTMQRSRTLVTAVACTAAGFQLVSAALTFSLATQVQIVGNLAAPLAYAAATFDICAVVSFVAVVVFHLRATEKLALAWIPALVLYFVGLVLTWAAMGYTLTRSATAPVDSSRDSAFKSTCVAGLVVSTIGMIPVATAFTWTWLHRDDPRSAQVEFRIPSRAEGCDMEKRSMSLQLTALPTLPPSFTPYSSTTPRSSMSSLPKNSDRVGRPWTPRAKIFSAFLSRESSHGAHSSTSTVDPGRDVDEFAGWEPSTPADMFESPSTRHTLMPTRLETIPGSRPVSTADALQGPFGSNSPSSSPSKRNKDKPLPELSPFQITPYHSTVASPAMSESGSLRHFPSRPSSRSGPPPTTRRVSASTTTGPNGEQTLIHPLFRAESPGPPPLASPGTIITASPFAGQVIGPDHVLAPRILGTTSAPGSRPASRCASRNTSRPPSRSASPGLGRAPSPAAIAARRASSNRCASSTSLVGGGLPSPLATGPPALMMAAQAGPERLSPLLPQSPSAVPVPAPVAMRGG